MYNGADRKWYQDTFMNVYNYGLHKNIANSMNYIQVEFWCFSGINYTIGEYCSSDPIIFTTNKFCNKDGMLKWELVDLSSTYSTLSLYKHFIFSTIAEVKKILLA